jgi:Ca2+-binding EF-hand superfamily protein
MLNLPGRIRTEDGSRDAFEKVFREIDKDGGGTIDWGEFWEYFRGLAKVRGWGGAGYILTSTPTRL